MYLLMPSLLQVFDVLVPLVVESSDPLPLARFTSKCCDLLLPMVSSHMVVVSL
jgi:hypothetical protein